MCHEHKKPLISGAAEGMLGIVAAFNFKEDSPCYECLFPRNYNLNENTCQNSGITPSVLGIIGSFMAIKDPIMPSTEGVIPEFWQVFSFKL